MIKGHLEIELHNHKTGSKERIEQDNLVTNALTQLINYAAGRNKAQGSMLDLVMPIHQKALGGIMIFEDPLVESANNVHFPHDNFLVAYAGQDLNTSDTECGSINYTESGEITNGFRTVWDFSTSQANGQISSMALTNSAVYNTSASSHTPALGNRIVTEQVSSANITTDAYSFPIMFENNCMYAVNGSTTNQILRHLYYPIDSYMVTDAVSQKDPLWRNDEQAIPVSNSKPYIDGKDGYFYSLKAREDVSDSTAFKDLVIIKVYKSSYQIANTFRIRVRTAVPSGEGSSIPWSMGVPLYLSCDTITISQGILYLVTNKIRTSNGTTIEPVYNLLEVHAIDLNQVVGGDDNPILLDSTYKIATINLSEYDDLVPSIWTNANTYSSEDCIRLSPGNNGCCILEYRYSNVVNTNTQQWRCIVVRPDGTYKIYNKIYNGASGVSNNEYLRVDNNIVSFNRDNHKGSLIMANYLGTICNIAQPFEKTNTTSMKVKYSLTNV